MVPGAKRLLSLNYCGKWFFAACIGVSFFRSRCPGSPINTNCRVQLKRNKLVHTQSMEDMEWDLLCLLQRCSPDALLFCAAELVKWDCVCAWCLRLAGAWCGFLSLIIHSCFDSCLPFRGAMYEHLCVVPPGKRLVCLRAHAQKYSGAAKTHTAEQHGSPQRGSRGSSQIRL